jgi:hypothetical protein
MITKTKQDWAIGKQVKVGFLTLTVTGIQAIKDGLPDIYSLESSKGVKYEFTPHYGLQKIN